MAKNLKLNIKNAQLAKALNLSKVKKAKEEAEKKKAEEAKKAAEAKKQKEALEAKRIAEEKEAAVKKEVEKAKEPPPIKEPVKKAPKKEEPKEEPPPPKKGKPLDFRNFRDVKPQKKPKSTSRAFDSRDRQGLRDQDGEGWRRKRKAQQKAVIKEEVIRPKNLKIRLPITVKDLASEMKLKASELIAKLFLQGIAVTINDYLDDETTVQLLGHEFECEIEIDTSEEERLRITENSIQEEIEKTPPEDLKIRPPIITFMGHVDHGKTSLIDAIRKTNLTADEAGAITQHIGAFRSHTSVGDVTILDTPGHEAFTAMRMRGADVTDVVVLVIAGDEGIRAQTDEAIAQALEAKKPLVVAINKCDKPNFNADNIYRELADRELLPEAWGGEIITVNCSAFSKEGIPELLELLGLQAEIMELKANPKARARGSVIESQLHKGLGSIATVLVQNGTLRLGDAIVFDQDYGRVKTMHDEFGKELTEAGPSTPVKITGLSGIPDAGSEFIVVKTEKEAKEISKARLQEGKNRKVTQPAKLLELDNMLKEEKKKVLNLVIRADVQGSLEALQNSLMKIKSTKAELNIVSTEVGEISESDIRLAAASGATILGFHTKIEAHAEDLIKQLGVSIFLHTIIYHAVDEIKDKMRSLLDKIEEETDTGEAEVLETFKSSQLGIIAGCKITDGLIKRSHLIRQIREGEIIWKGTISSIKRVQEDVKEIAKGFECGIVLQGTNDIKKGDLLQAYELTYHAQDL